MPSVWRHRKEMNSRFNAVALSINHNIKRLWQVIPFLIISSSPNRRMVMAPCLQWMLELLKHWLSYNPPRIIVFDDGVRCHNEQELKAAILAYNNTLASRKQVESNATKAQTPRWVRVAVIIGLILLFILVDSLNFHILF